jgi:hypothetical protein
MNAKSMCAPKPKTVYDCPCPRRPDGSLDTPDGMHACPLRGNTGGMNSPEALKRKRANYATVSTPGGKEELARIAKKAGYANASALVTAAAQHADRGGEFDRADLGGEIFCAR